MPYYKRIKADLDIFQKMMVLDVYDKLKLFPIRNPETEANYYLLNSNTEDIKKYLPGAFVTDLNGAMERIIQNIDRTLLYQGILYNLTIVPENDIIGHILLQSPLAATKLGEWSIDFWIRDVYRNNGIMTNSIYKILLYMKQMQIETVVTTVFVDNIGSRRVLEKVGFSVVSKNNYGQLLYSLSLNIFFS